MDTSKIVGEKIKALREDWCGICYSEYELQAIGIGVSLPELGYAMLSLIQHEIVDLHHWLTPQQFTDVVAISQMTPGPIGINSATYVGYAVTQSVWGAVLATVAVCLPSFILVLLISYFFAKCKDNKYIKAAMSGLLPMSVALIASAALLMMNRENFIDYKSIGIFAAAFLVTWKWNLHPILLICLAGVVGLLLY
jgi:chromate transporter